MAIWIWRSDLDQSISDHGGHPLQSANPFLIWGKINLTLEENCFIFIKRKKFPQNIQRKKREKKLIGVIYYLENKNEYLGVKSSCAVPAEKAVSDGYGALRAFRNDPAAVAKHPVSFRIRQYDCVRR